MANYHCNSMCEIYSVTCYKVLLELMELKCFGTPKYTTPAASAFIAAT
jgi:hypothetical protein